ncbi:hypothetical protein [Aurantiacibacter zhengii]|nr:hypothetical protein [Aurantiacibacter zhengii]
MITNAHADLLATAYVQQNPDADPQAVGHAILVENARAVRSTYEDRHGAAADGEAQARRYRYRPWRGNIEPDFLHVQACCANYQCSDGLGFHTTFAGEVIARLIIRTGGFEREMPEGYPWGVDCHPEDGPALKAQLAAMERTASIVEQLKLNLEWS